jgi:hypothetical protein
MSSNKLREEYIEKVRHYYNILSNELFIDSSSVDSFKDIIRIFRQTDRPEVWIFKTNPRKPLTIKTTSHQVITEIEISFDIEAIVNEVRRNEFKTRFNKYNIQIKMWSNKAPFCFRQEYDSEQMKEKIRENNNRRVMLRFHFDKRTKDTDPELFYHFHVGGDQEIDEFFWIPQQVDIPRIPHPPMDPLLILEMILQNFYKKDRSTKKIYDILMDPDWRTAVCKSQRIFQMRYFEKCCEFLAKPEKTLVEHAREFRVKAKT